MKQTIEIEVPDGFVLDASSIESYLYPEEVAGSYIVLALTRKPPRKMVLVEQFTDYIEEGMYYKEATSPDLYYCLTPRPKEDYMISIWAIEGATE